MAMAKDWCVIGDPQHLQQDQYIRELGGHHGFGDQRGYGHANRPSSAGSWGCGNDGSKGVYPSSGGDCGFGGNCGSGDSGLGGKGASGLGGKGQYPSSGRGIFVPPPYLVWGCPPAPLTDPPQAPPPPPPEGWYNRLYACAFEAGFTAGYERARRDASLEAEGQSKKRKWELAWKEWRETYTPLKAANKKQQPWYFTKLRPDWVEAYPVQIQEKLQKLALEVEDSLQSKETEYYMGEKWVYTLRLFNQEERSQWEKYLKKHSDGDDDWVGAQWNKAEARNQPPEKFDNHVTYRPIYLTNFQ